ncbi:hydroxysteroid dehydrogenase-like protein 1 [Condylostylus longicornis]|uniref:hydroxysteroid dehydrogenase-like protein 1 n=1 Tax=Condylostylus longicornis TaxID=2530218 RepID=UPI00244DB9CC|nr:hydroxysteroid dehydrogenase-like protein 1 [Condylostylus longicornis]
MWSIFFCILGIYTFVRYLYSQLRSPILILFSYLRDLLLPIAKKSLTEKYGNWAVITGSTDGMGKSYAKHLALKGFNIVLISRSEEKLKAVQNEIESEAGVEVRYIVADFTQNFEIYDKIAKQLEDIPVGILANNVGLSRSIPGSFDEHSEKLIWDMILVNITATMLMTKIVLPGMKQRGKGAIVNISSICVLVPLIHNAGVYAACKKCVSSMTKILQWELMDYKNIDVQLIEPCFVDTNMINFSQDIKNHSVTCSSDEWAKNVIALLGRTNTTNGHFKHALVAFIMSSIPETLRTLLIYRHAQSFDYKKS